MGAIRENPQPHDFDRLRETCRAYYYDLIAFVTEPAFQAVHAELMALPVSARPDFVTQVLLNDAELLRRGVRRPSDILIQRSAFGDRRPTLYCVKKWLPKDLQMFWENVNLTFDNEFRDAEVPRGAAAWRTPVPIPLQHEILAGRVPPTVAEQVVAGLERNAI